MNRDHYRTLEVSRDASASEIHRAFRALAMRYHPDRNPAPDAAANMIAVNEAYEVLRDPGLRQDYDRETPRAPADTALAASILQAARDTVLRGGWKVVDEKQPMSLLLEKGAQRLRILFLNRLNNGTLARILKQHGQAVVVLAVEIESAIDPAPQTTVIDLLRPRRPGTGLSGLADPAVRSLLAPFL